MAVRKNLDIVCIFSKWKVPNHFMTPIESLHTHAMSYHKTQSRGLINEMKTTHQLEISVSRSLNSSPNDYVQDAVLQLIVYRPMAEEFLSSYWVKIDDNLICSVYMQHQCTRLMHRMHLRIDFSELVLQRGKCALIWMPMLIRREDSVPTTERPSSCRQQCWIVNVFARADGGTRL